MVAALRREVRHEERVAFNFASYALLVRYHLLHQRDMDVGHRFAPTPLVLGKDARLLMSWDWLGMMSGGNPRAFALGRGE